jgi:chitin disaccharide deacetylase
MSSTRHLIVNADDFGQSPGITEGVIEAFERGIVTSTSMMVRWQTAPEAAGYAKKHPDLSVGLHIDLGEWAYRQGGWVPLYDVVQKDDAVAVAEEIARQFAECRRLLGREPSHIDSHQHVQRSEPIASILAEKADRIGVPLRWRSKVRYCGAFYGQTAEGEPLAENISLNNLKKLLSELAPGITELGCHPAKRVDFDAMYTTERLQELGVLCDGNLREFLAESGIHLCSFQGVSELL